MHTTKLAPAQWTQTLDALSRAFDGALVSVEILGNETGAQPQVIDKPLRGISSDRGVVTIQIAKDDMHLEHHIALPSEVRVVETDEGALIAVEIEESEGTHTLLRFHSPARPELFDSAVE